MAANKKIEKVVIVGGGTAGWITAALLSKMLGKTLDISLIESDQIGTISVGEATVPPIKRLNRVLGIGEADFVKATQGTFKLGIIFENWGNIGERYMHAFGGVGVKTGRCDFFSFWKRSQNNDAQKEFWDYSLNARAAEENKFAKIPNDPKKNIGGLTYAYHFDAGLYAKYLRQRAEDQGVVRIEGKINKVNKVAKSGDIKSVTLESGEAIAGDFFIDCSGMRSLLLGEALGVEFEDWSAWLPCDRAMAVQSKNMGEPSPYTVSSAQVAGWQWRIPLQHRTGNGLVYSSKFLTDDEAKEILLSNLQGEALTEPRVIPFKTGAYKEQWSHNCVGIGLSASFIEPMESTSIHLIQRAAFKLIDKFPRNGIKQSDVTQYNNEFTREYYNVRDLIIAHYHLNNRDDSEFWVQCREMDIPDSLKLKLDIFREAGKVYREEDVFFQPNSWYQTMMGQGIVPEDYSPLADNLSDSELETMLSKISENVEAMVDRMPSQAKFIEKHCKAPTVQ